MSVTSAAPLSTGNNTVDVSTFLQSDPELNSTCPVSDFSSPTAVAVADSSGNESPAKHGNRGRKRKTMSSPASDDEGQADNVGSLAPMKQQHQAASGMVSSGVSSSSSMELSSNNNSINQDITALPLSSIAMDMTSDSRPSTFPSQSSTTTSSNIVNGLRRSTRARRRTKQLVLSMNDKDTAYAEQEYDPEQQEKIWQTKICGNDEKLYQEMVKEEENIEASITQYDEEFDEKAAKEAEKSDAEDDLAEEAEDEEQPSEEDNSSAGDAEAEEDSEDEFIQKATRSCKEDDDSTDEEQEEGEAKAQDDDDDDNDEEEDDEDEEAN